MELYQLYQSSSVSGTKDWAIMAHPGGVKIRYGSTGSKLRLTEIPLSKCEKGSPELEVQKRIRKQLSEHNNDYRFVDQVTINDDGVVGELTNPNLKEKLFWVASITPQNQAEFDEVRKTVEATAELIAEAYPGEVSLLRPVDGVSLNGYSITFHRGDTAQTNNICVESGHGTGILTFNTGLYPALWVLLIAHKLRGSFQLSADSTPQSISPYLQPIAFIREEDCRRFEAFASQHGLLSPEECLLLACKDVSETVDWL